MPTNPHFWNVGDSGEQTLMEDLVEEVIQIFGIDFYYVPRTVVKLDKLYETDDISKFVGAFPIEMYVNDYNGFQGDGSFLSKFGIEIRDQITFTVSRRRFETSIAPNLDFWRPRESDLIYYPLNKKLFEIKFVENKAIHYPMGTLPTYVLFCELYEYSDQEFDTGIGEIDSIQEELSNNILDYTLQDENGNALVTENGDYIVTDDYDINRIDPLADNEDIENEVSDLIDWSEDNPFGRLENES